MSRLAALLSGLRVKEAPLEWVLEVNQRPVRICITSLGVVLALQGAMNFLTMKHQAPGIIMVICGVVSIIARCLLATAERRSCRPRVRMSIIVAWVTFVMAGTMLAAPVIDDVLYRARYHVSAAFFWKNMPATLGFPVFVAAMYLLVSCLMDWATYVLCTVRYGDVLEMRVFTTSVVVSLFGFLVASFSSSHMMSLFDYKTALAAEKALMESIIHMMCDGIMWLSEDGSKVLASDRRIEAVLGKPVVGGDTSEVISESERERFKEVLERARAEPLLLPSTLKTATGRNVHVDLFIAGNRETRAQAGAKRTPAFLIGIRYAAKPDELDLLPALTESSRTILQKSSRSNTSAELNPDQDQDQDQDLDEDGAAELRAWRLGQRGHDADDQSDLDGLVPPLPDDQASLPTTTATGKVFKGVNVGDDDEPGSLDVAGEMEARLARIVDLGEREGWILSDGVMNLQPSERLGAGAFGEVVRGTVHGSPVAAKTTRLDEEGCVTVEHLAALANEIRVLRHTRHPNVVLFRGAYIGARSMEVILVTEMVSGCDLFKYVLGLQIGSEPIKRRQLLLDVASALWYLHAQSTQIVHGDLKSENILVEPMIPRAKILDFGLARFRTKGSEPLGGSLRWMAPELICGRRQPTVQADTFSFGRVAYMTITSRKPLHGMTREAMIQSAQRGVQHNLPFQDGVILHAECQRLCHRTLKLAPEQRPAMAEVHRAIESWMPTPALTPADALEELNEEMDSEGAQSGPLSEVAARGRHGVFGWFRNFFGGHGKQPAAAQRFAADAEQASGNLVVAGAGPRATAAAVAEPAGASTGAKRGSPATEAGTTGRADAPLTEGVAAAHPVPPDPEGAPVHARLGLALPGRRPTGDSAGKMLLMETALRMNFPQAPCCPLHGATGELVRLSRELHNGHCQKNFKPASGFQCSMCGVLDVDTSLTTCPACHHAPSNALQLAAAEQQLLAPGRAAHIETL